MRGDWMTVLGVAAAMQAAPVWAVEVGTPAPDFSVTDTRGEPRTLAGLRGKFVVLEWFNPECPFTRKHYGTGNMQQLQQAYTGRGVVWLSVDSSAPGKQGHLTAEEANAFMEELDGHPTAVLLDPDGTLGRQYGAATTPHLFVINPAGVLIYQGAIDDAPSLDPADVETAANYVEQALDAALEGKPVPVASTQPYGCSVKYE